MRPADLFRRTSFRLALGVALFILVALVLASSIGYGVMRRHLLARQDDRVTEIFAALEQTSRDADTQDLIDAVKTRIAASTDFSTIYLLRETSGAVLAANIPDVWVRPGWSTVEAATFGIVTDYPYRVFAGTMAGRTVVVGLTNADLDDLAEIVLGGFGWTALFALIAALGAGAVIATRVQTRLAAAEATLHSVAKGDLAARLPVTPRGDDLDQISSAINAALTRLGGLVDAMRQVSTDIAHDLRTPLNRLRIHVETAAGNAAMGRPVADDLAAALAESDTISVTFAALLRIAQIEAGARREKFTRVDLADIAEALSEVYAEVAEDAGMAFSALTGRPAIIEGDKELLTQMFANLIENAIRHCPAGTAIACAVEVEGAGVVATITDSGPGIPLEERELVLRRLYRLEKSRTTPGSGLGLSLVKAVADLHEAKLTLGDARPGLQVCLTFPKASPEV
jgi:signal transduction histidine kinase